MQKRARILKSKTIYRGRVVELKVDRVIEPGGVETTREIVCHPGSVVVVPHLPDGRLILVRQYRHAVKESLWELVAGGMERGKPLARARAASCWKRPGTAPASSSPCWNSIPSPGILSEKMHLVEAGT